MSDATGKPNASKSEVEPRTEEQVVFAPSPLAPLELRRTTRGARSAHRHRLRAGASHRTLSPRTHRRWARRPLPCPRANSTPFTSPSATVCAASGASGRKGAACASGRPAAGRSGVAVPPCIQSATKPLISLETFGFHVPLRYEPDKPIYISEFVCRASSFTCRPSRTSCICRRRPNPAPPPRARSDALHPSEFQLGSVDCTDAHI